jgi:uncharacterized membrane protein
MQPEQKQSETGGHTSSQNSGLTRVVERNIRTLHARRQRETAAASLQDRIADAITRFTGSMIFVCLHLLIFGLWIVINLGWLPGIPAFDESFVVLAMVASVEAIFLSTFVLITQNRMAAAADKRADLDVQISLVAEHELTELTRVVRQIADKLGLSDEADKQLQDAQREIAPEAVLDEIENTERNMKNDRRGLGDRIRG